MTTVLLLMLASTQIGPPDTFSVRTELQGLYDEISQATLQFETASDVDQFHDVLYTSDWVFVDANGQRHSWSQVRQDAVDALDAPRVDSLTQAIQTLSLVPGGATVLVNVTTVRTIVDHEGHYGHKDDSHTLSEITAFRDGWVRVSDDDWKLNRREQIGQPRVLVDKTTSEYKR